jgi:hypothetical protein
MPEILLFKSKQNETALSYLIDQSLFSPAVHCGYYSCLQKVMYIWENYYGETQDEVNKIVKSKGSSHGYYIRELSAKLSNDFDRIDGKDFERKMIDLRNYRLESDYKKIEITENTARKMKNYVSTVHSIIKTHMQE